MTVNLMVGTKTYAVSDAFSLAFNSKASDNVINFQDIVDLQTAAGAATTIESKFIAEQLKSGGISKKLTVSGDAIVVTNKHNVTTALLQNFITMSADNILSGKEITQLKASATGTGTTSESLFISALVGTSAVAVKPKTLAVGALIGLDSNGDTLSNSVAVNLYQAETQIIPNSSAAEFLQNASSAGSLTASTNAMNAAFLAAKVILDGDLSGLASIAGLVGATGFPNPNYTEYRNLVDKFYAKTTEGLPAKSVLSFEKDGRNKIGGGTAVFAANMAGLKVLPTQIDSLMGNSLSSVQKLSEIDQFFTNYPSGILMQEVGYTNGAIKFDGKGSYALITKSGNDLKVTIPNGNIGSNENSRILTANERILLGNTINVQMTKLVSMNTPTPNITPVDPNLITITAGSKTYKISKTLKEKIKTLSENGFESLTKDKLKTLSTGLSPHDALYVKEQLMSAMPPLRNVNVDGLNVLVSVAKNFSTQFLNMLNVRVSDNLLTYDELDQLSLIAKSVDEKAYVAGLPRYDSYGANTIQSVSGTSNITLNSSVVKIGYDDQENWNSLSAEDIVDKITQVSDRDLTTVNNKSTCVPHSIINHILLTPSKGITALKALGTTFGVDLTNITPANITKLADKMFSSYGGKAPGTSFLYSSNGDLIGGQIKQLTETGTLNTGTPLIAAQLPRENGKRDIVAYLMANPDKHIFATVNNTVTGPIGTGKGNHQTLLTLRGGEVWIADPGTVPGKDLGYRKIPNQLLYELQYGDMPLNLFA